MPISRSTTTAFQKPLRVLKALSDPEANTLKKIAEAADLDTTSAFRALQVLMDEGFVQRDTISKAYRYGDEAYVLAVALNQRRDVRTVAHPALLRLACVTGDLVTLVVRSGYESVVVDREAGGFPLQISVMNVGSRRPLGVGAGSLALVAWTDPEDLVVVLSRLDTVLSRYSNLTVQDIRDEIAAARQRGYACMYGAVVPDVGAIAQPIRGLDGRVCAALSVAGLAKSMASREKQIAEEVAREVKEIEKALWQAPG